MSDLPARRTCTALNKAGEPCRSRPLVDSNPALCFSHTDSSQTKQFFGAGHPATPGSGRPRKPTLGDIVREQILNDPAGALRPILEARDSAVIVLASVKDGVVVTEEPDHAVRLRAASEFISLGFAKAKSDAELVVEQGVDGGVVVRLAFDPKPEEA